MEKILNYRIIPDKRIIIEHFSGLVDVNDLIACQNNVSYHADYNPNFNVVIDFRDARLSLSEPDVLKYIHFVRSTTKIYGSRREAHITGSPHQVVAATMFEILKKDLPVNVKIVSTVGAAANWVGLDFNDIGMVEQAISTFKLNIGVVG